MKQFAGLMTAAFIVSACGTPPAEETGSTQGQTSNEVQVSEEARAAKSKCEQQVAPIQDALQELDGRLDVGMNNAAYSERLGDVSVAYNKIDVDTLAPGCLDIAVHYENAFNRYISASNRWDACIRNYTCDEPDVQGLWARASNEIEKGDTKLKNVKTFEETS
jgi:hypothetical protein